jgi:hypothetical protein
MKLIFAGIPVTTVDSASSSTPNSDTSAASPSIEDEWQLVEHETGESSSKAHAEITKASIRNYTYDERKSEPAKLQAGDGK